MLAVVRFYEKPCIADLRDLPEVVLITNEEVLKIAQLAHLSFEADELEGLRNDLNSILDYVEALNEVDTEGVEATSHPVATTMRLREDVAESRLTSDEVLSNAPAKAEGQFQVPKVVAS